MVHTIATSMFWGKPLIMYGGLLTLILLLFTATVGFMNYRGVQIIPLPWHFRLALVVIAFALLHGIFGLSIYFGF